jgi:hypothetical protein
MAVGNHSSVPEGFKEIPGYGGRYFINQQGDVWSVARRRLMSPQTERTHPYPWVLLREGDGARPRTVYYLMRLTWMPPAPGEVGIGGGKWCVNHKDGDKFNNHIDNLEWVTTEENLRHAWRNDLHGYGENCYRAQFTSDEVRQIRLRLLLGEKVKDLAAEFDTNKETIKKIQQYVSWKRQDWDLIEPMMQVCSSKWLHITLNCIKRGGEFYDYSRQTSKLR